MSSFASLVAVMTLFFPLISNSEMVCIKNTESSEAASQCIYLAKSDKKGEKIQKREAGVFSDDIAERASTIVLLLTKSLQT